MRVIGLFFNGLTLYVNEVVQGYYRTTSIGGIPNSYDWNIDNVARLWTVQDAKEGDVLVASDESLFIFARAKDNAAYYHFSLCKNGSQEISDGKHAWEGKFIQRTGEFHKIEPIPMKGFQGFRYFG